MNKEVIKALRMVMKEELTPIHEQFKKVDIRFDAIDKRFNVIDVKFDAIDKRFNEIDSKLEGIIEQVAHNT